MVLHNGIITHTHKLYSYRGNSIDSLEMLNDIRSAMPTFQLKQISKMNIHTYGIYYRIREKFNHLEQTKLNNEKSRKINEKR